MQRTVPCSAQNGGGEEETILHCCDVRHVACLQWFTVSKWWWGKSKHFKNRIVDRCNALFPAPPGMEEVRRKPFHVDQGGQTACTVGEQL